LPAAGARRWLTASPVLLLGLVPLIGNWRDASRAGETATREWAHDLLNSVEPYGVLITQGDNDTFPLWYAQEVEGVRRDVTVAVTSLLNTDWYPRALMRRPIVPYDAARGPAVYRAGRWTMPTRPILSLSTEQVNAVPDYLDVREPQLFQHEGIRALVDPRLLQFGVPLRADLLVLQLLKDNLGSRPFYIARTSGNYVQALGLEGYALMQGLASKIVGAPVATSADTVAVRGVGHLDVGRSLALWRGFGAPHAFIARGDWVDRPSVGIPVTYVSTALLLGDVLEQAGRTGEAESMRRVAVDVGQATRTLDLFTAAPQPVAPPTPSGDAPRGAPVRVKR
jgi:hypothetical protein